MASLRLISLVTLSLGAGSLAAPLGLALPGTFIATASTCSALASRTDLLGSQLATFGGLCSAAGISVGINPSTVTDSACLGLYTDGVVDSSLFDAFARSCVAAKLTVGPKPVKTGSGSFVIDASFCGNLRSDGRILSADLDVYAAACAALHLDVHPQTVACGSGTFDVTASFCAALRSDVRIASADLPRFLDACAVAHLVVNPRTCKTNAGVFSITAEFCLALYSNVKIDQASTAMLADACAAASFKVNPLSVVVGAVASTVAGTKLPLVRRSVVFDASTIISAKLCSVLPFAETLRLLGKSSVVALAQPCANAGLIGNAQALASRSLSLVGLLDADFCAAAASEGAMKLVGKSTANALLRACAEFQGVTVAHLNCSFASCVRRIAMTDPFLPALAETKLYFSALSLSSGVPRVLSAGQEQGEGAGQGWTFASYRRITITFV